MKNPYKIEGPALISFSGGRTSGYMLYKILEAYDGKLPNDIHVVFANRPSSGTLTVPLGSPSEHRIVGRRRHG